MQHLKWKLLTYPHAWTKHCPQRKDIKINREEKEKLNRRSGEKKEGGDQKYASQTKSLNIT